MTLTTISERISDTNAHVFWRVGTKNKGILDIALTDAQTDSALIAELFAIQYLLFDKQVLDRAPGSGTGYRLVVSKGAIKKLALGKSDKLHALKYAAFLTNRMRGVAIEVSPSPGFMALPHEVEIESLGCGHKDHLEYDTVDTPAMGKIQITHHAFEQYQARITSGDPKKPWASLVGRLMHPDLEQIEFSGKVAVHKARKYGRLDECWSHPTSRFHYIVSRGDDGVGVLVTVFEREK